MNSLKASPKEEHQALEQFLIVAEALNYIVTWRTVGKKYFSPEAYIVTEASSKRWVFLSGKTPTKWLDRIFAIPSRIW